MCSKSWRLAWWASSAARFDDDDVLHGGGIVSLAHVHLGDVGVNVDVTELVIVILKDYRLVQCHLLGLLVMTFMPAPSLPLVTHTCSASRCSRQ